MADRLTDKNAKTGSFANDDLLHIVDVSDTADNAAGSSYKVELLDLFSSFTWIRIGSYMVVKRNVSPNTNIIQEDDWLIYFSLTRLVIGIAKDTISVEADLDDTAKFIKFIDASPII